MRTLNLELGLKIFCPNLKYALLRLLIPKVLLDVQLITKYTGLMLMAQESRLLRLNRVSFHTLTQL